MRRVLCGILSALCIFFAHSLPASAETEVLRSVPTDGMQIALTFDDGPHPFLTPRILEILDRYGVHATFFMVGRNVINYPAAARQVIESGHEVGNHTYSHGHMEALDTYGVGEELGRCEDALEELCEYRPHLFRPPEGRVTEPVMRCSEEGDYTLVLWSLDTRDWETKNADEIVVLEQGNVVERGRHEELLLKNGKYAEMYNAQFATGSFTAE